MGYLHLVILIFQICVCINIFSKPELYFIHVLRGRVMSVLALKIFRLSFLSPGYHRI